jgi:hypothetical protein
MLPRVAARDPLPDLTGRDTGVVTLQLQGAMGKRKSAATFCHQKVKLSHHVRKGCRVAVVPVGNALGSICAAEEAEFDTGAVGFAAFFGNFDDR